MATPIVIPCQRRSPTRAWASKRCTERIAQGRILPLEDAAGALGPEMTTPDRNLVKVACDVHSILLCVEACDTGFDLELDIESVYHAQRMGVFGSSCTQTGPGSIALQRRRACLQSRPAARIVSRQGGSDDP